MVIPLDYEETVVAHYLHKEVREEIARFSRG
ncbi:MAG: hypothetical protein AOA65_0727 [Candidatus Bathyarchaeota archaeon BA1]|nr:MAG: hypothetical protein AOA65_0727 [Candidatus Bathyarchaeota archaeon BA1]